MIDILKYMGISLLFSLILWGLMLGVGTSKEAISAAIPASFSLGSIVGVFVKFSKYF